MRRRVPLRFAQALDQTALRRERLQAAAPAAPAQPVVAGDRRVPDLAAHRQRALVDPAAQHQRAADAVGDVDHDEVVAVGTGAQLAERERAHLLHQPDGRRPDLAQDPGQIGVLGPVQVGRQQDAPHALVDDAGRADQHRPGPLDLDLLRALHDLLLPGLGVGRRLELHLPAVLLGRRRRHSRHARHLDAQIHDHEPRAVGGEAQLLARTADAGAAAVQQLDLLDDARVHQVVDDLARGGLAHPRRLRELGAARGLAPEQLPKQRGLIRQPQVCGDRGHGLQALPFSGNVCNRRRRWRLLVR